MKTFRNIFFLILFFTLLPLSVLAANENIVSYNDTVYLNNDGTFTVQEAIAYDFGQNSRHGIERTISTRAPQSSDSFFTERYIRISNVAVTMDTGLKVPFTRSDSANAVTIKIGDPDTTITGTHVYTLSYTVTGGYSYFSDGTAEIYWNATGNGWNVPIQTAQAILHQGTAKFADNSRCYKGPAGSTQNCQTQLNETGDVRTFTATQLLSGSGLTFAQALAGDSIAHVVLTRINMLHVLLILVPIVFLAAILFVYRYKTKYKIKAPIIAQYEPYADCKPMYTGVLFDNKLDARDSTAGIVYLAQQGFFKIKKIDKKILFVFNEDDYEITLLRTVSEAPNASLRKIMLLIFDETAPVGAVVSLSALRNDTLRQQQNYTNIQDIKKTIKTELEESDYFESNFLGMLTRRTHKGYEALNYLKGFKLFLSVTDKERFAFHDAPQKSPEQFMEYLPYAIAFGVEKQWAQVFEGITIPNPDWYDSGVTVGTFSAVNFASNISSFSTSLASSTSVSSTSGSGGGGFSGGGGGGGGGGSW